MGTILIKPSDISYFLGMLHLNLQQFSEHLLLSSFDQIFNRSAFLTLDGWLDRWLDYRWNRVTWR